MGWQHTKYNMGETRAEYKLNENKQAHYLALIRKGYRIGDACKAVGITRVALWEFKRRHPEFALLEEEAEAEYCDQIEKSLLRATDNLNMTAIIFWLTNRSKGRWIDKRTPDVKIQVSATQNPDELKKKLEQFLENHHDPESLENQNGCAPS